MSKQRLGKRERMARKRRISMRKQGHLWVNTVCDKCNVPGSWEFNPAKASKITFKTKLVCGQCRSGNKTSAGDPVVGS